MKIDPSAVKKLVELSYWYEHVPVPFTATTVTIDRTGYVYFKADEILPILSTLEKGLHND